MQWNGPGYSTDGGYLSVALSMSVALGRRPAPAPVASPASPTRPSDEAAPRMVVQPSAAPVAPDPEVLALIERALPAQRLERLAPVLFAFDSDRLEPIGVAMLHEVARTLRSRDDIAFLETIGVTKPPRPSGHR